MLPVTRSTSSRHDAPPALLGSTTPRLWTPELRPLTPETSFGFDLIDFAADVVGEPFDPWQEWLSIHAGELLPDGRPRFRKLLILVARQNGKTHWAKTLIKYWLFLEQVPTILGTSTDRSYAKRTWQQVVAESRENEWFMGRLGPNAERKTIGEETLVTLDKAEYTFAANNKRAGRSMTLHKWLCDEVREHKDLDTWNAASKAQNAVSTAQAVCISNQGDDTAVVLDMLRGPAIEYIETGQGDQRLGLFEWSAPDGCEPDDVEGLRQANPNLGRPGHGPELDVLVADARQAARAGGLELTGHRTEVLCQRVMLLDPAIEPALWAGAATATPLDLAEHRQAVALCLDVSLSGDHAALVAAAAVNGRVHLDVVAAWSGYGCTRELRADLPGLVARIRPRALGWFPTGPAAVVAADLETSRARGWPPRRVTLEALTTEAATAAMSFAALVRTGEIVHGADPMLDAHIGNAQRLRLGDRWTFGRRGSGPVDGAYAAAGATWLARTLPAAPPPLSAA